MHCAHCTAAFRRRQSLVRHLRLHTGEKPYRCSDCTMQFVEKDAIRKHVKTHQRARTRPATTFDNYYETPETSHKEYGSDRKPIHLHEAILKATCELKNVVTLAHNKIYHPKATNARCEDGEQTVTATLHCGRIEMNYFLRKWIKQSTGVLLPLSNFEWPRRIYPKLKRL